MPLPVRPGIKSKYRTAKIALVSNVRRTEADRIEITLSDPPPSLNNAYANVAGKGRVRSKLYNLWIESAGWEARQQAKCRVGGTVSIDITVFRMVKTSDISNRIKALEDLLVAHDLIDDDRFVMQVTARWSDIPGCRIVVERVVNAGVAA